MNAITLFGNLGRAPELRYTDGGTPVVNFPMATNQTWTDDAGETRQSVQWHDCVAYGSMAEVLDEYAEKGTRLLVRGKVTYNTWEDENGTKRRNTNVKVQRFDFAGSNADQDGGASSGDFDPEEDFEEEDDLPF